MAIPRLPASPRFSYVLRLQVLQLPVLQMPLLRLAAPLRHLRGFLARAASSQQVLQVLQQVIELPVLRLTLLRLSTTTRQLTVLRPQVVQLPVLQLAMLWEYTNPSIVCRTGNRAGTGTLLAGTRHRRLFRSDCKVVLQFVRTLDRSV